MPPDLEPIDVRATRVEQAGEPLARRRRLVRAVGLALVVLAAGGLGVAITRTGVADRRTPEEAMAALRSFLSEANSVHFDGTWRPAQGNPPQSPATTTSLSRFDGDVSLPHQGRWIHDNGDSVNEGVVVAGGAYYRAAGNRAELRSTPWRWRVLPEPATLGAHPIASFVTFVHDVPIWLNGLDFAALAHLADGVESAEATGDGVYRGRFRLEGVPIGAPPIFGSEGRWTVEFTVAGDGRLERAVWRPKPDNRVVLDIRFSRWGHRVRLAVPGIDDVDVTPEIDEEAVAAFGAAPLLAPATLPEGWALLAACRSGFPEAELRRILDHLVPLDLATQPVQRSVPPVGGR